MFSMILLAIPHSRWDRC